MTLETFDLVVIGGGNAGVAAAGVARRAGWRVALVEEDLLGGTCPNRGCVPKKVLVAACEVVDHARRAQGHGVAGELHIDWDALQARRRSIVEPIAASTEASLAERGVELVRGRARFVAARTVAVGDRRLAGRKIVIATGSMPRPLAFPGAELVATSDELLAAPRAPRTAAFVGAGVIGMELAHVLARAGCERVVQLELGPRALPQADGDAVAALVEHGRTLGIELRTGVQIRAVAREGERFAIDVGGERIVVDLVCHGAGRVPRLEGLELQAAGITLERGRVALTPDLRCTEDADVAIVGDAAPGLPQLSPLATSLGRLVGENLVEDRHDAPDLDAVPSCVFAIPTLAQVGLTEDRARERGVDCEVKRTDGITGWISGRTHHEACAFAKVLVGRDDQIVGAHLLGHGAEEIIHLFAMAMRHRISATALAAGDAAYPTFSSDVKWLL
ncbi:MAG TPA: NAD(P)/FAD-dependent oxidoreductase [Kofleriaceae bacterium]|nr:NAD(P)/FAD-dependent oxidoreductase [Kofleriaceae bacterium]